MGNRRERRGRCAVRRIPPAVRVLMAAAQAAAPVAAGAATGGPVGRQAAPACRAADAPLAVGTAAKGLAPAAAGPPLRVAAPEAFGFLRGSRTPSAPGLTAVKLAPKLAPAAVPAHETSGAGGTSGTSGTRPGVRPSLEPPAATSQVIFDGTLGPAGPLQAVGNTFQIPADRGKVVGTNLFESFSQFSLSAGQSALFAAPASGRPVARVLVRVTGGGPSDIDGTLACGIPGADFFFVNPDGVLFGPDAALDVKGSAVVTTADYLKLGRGGTFGASGASGAGGPSGTSGSTLAAAAPSAFGFLAAPRGGITVQGSAARASTLAVPQGRVLSLIGGSVRIDQGRLEAAAGRVNLVSADSAGQVRGAATDPSGGMAVASFSRMGEVSVTGQSAVSLDGPAGGGIFVRAGDFTLDHSAVVSNTTGGSDGLTGDAAVTRVFSLTGNAVLSSSTAGTGAAGDLTVRAGAISVVQSYIHVDTSGAGRGGNLTLTARSLTIDETGNPQHDPSLSNVTVDSNSAAPGAGDAGDLMIRAGAVRLVGGAKISAATDGPGRGGNLTIRARTLDADATADTTRDLSGNSISADTNSPDPDAGQAGDLTIRAGTVRLTRGGSISADTAGAGRGGKLTLTAHDLTLQGSGDHPLTGATTIISAQSSEGATGPAGAMVVRAGTVKVLDGGVIDAAAVGAGRGGDLTLSASSLLLRRGGEIGVDTFGPAPGGTLRVSAGTVLIDGAGSADFTAISAATHSTDPGGGRGGDLSLRAGELKLLNGGIVVAASNLMSSGPAGDVNVVAGRLRLDGRNPLIQGIDPAGIVSQITARSLGAGTAGSVRVLVRHDMFLSHGASIGAESFFSSAGDVRVDGGGPIRLDGGHVSATAAATGGNVRVSTPLLTTLSNGSDVLTESGAADGGNVRIDALELVLAGGSGMSANGGINGGKIKLNADGFRGAVLSGPAANVTATGRTGTAGSIGVAPASEEVTGVLLPLAATLLPPRGLVPQCVVRLGMDVSTFVITGQGGRPPEPGGWLPDMEWPGGPPAPGAGIERP